MTVTVPAVRLDDEFAQLNRAIDFIKMDIEGAEYAALQGMQALLTQHHAVKLLAEFSPGALFEFGVAPQAMLDLLLALGFQLHWVTEDGLAALDLDRLHTQLPIMTAVTGQVIADMQAENRRYSIAELGETLVQRLHAAGYTRPLTENLFAVR
jgi:hypothetical protein